MYDLLPVVIFMPIYISMYSRPYKTFFGEKRGKVEKFKKLPSRVV